MFKVTQFPINILEKINDIEYYSLSIIIGLIIASIFSLIFRKNRYNGIIFGAFFFILLYISIIMRNILFNISDLLQISLSFALTIVLMMTYFRNKLTVKKVIFVVLLISISIGGFLYYQDTQENLKFLELEKEKLLKLEKERLAKLNTSCLIDNVIAPDWVCNPFIDGNFGGVGSAAKSPLGRSFQQIEAIANARDNLAKELGGKVKEKIVTLLGSHIRGIYRKIATNIQDDISSQRIEGARLKHRWKTPNNTLFIYVTLDPQGIINFKDVAEKIVKKHLKKNQTLYKDLLGKISIEELETISENIFSNTLESSKLFSKCAGCHGRNAEKSALGKSKIIAGWKPSKMEYALYGYKNGTYGGSMKGLMKGQVADLSNYQIRLLAEFISHK